MVKIMAKTNWNTMAKSIRTMATEYALYVLELGDACETLEKEVKNLKNLIKSNEERIAKSKDVSIVSRLESENKDYESKIAEKREESAKVKKGLVESKAKFEAIIPSTLWEAYKNRLSDKSAYTSAMVDFFKNTLYVDITESTLSNLMMRLGSTSSNGKGAKSDNLGLGNLGQKKFSEILCKSICVLDPCLKVSELAEKNGITMYVPKKGGKKSTK